MFSSNARLINLPLFFAIVCHVCVPVQLVGNDSVDNGKLVEEFWVSVISDKGNSATKVGQLHKIFVGKLHTAPPKWWIRNVRSMIEGEKPRAKPRSPWESSVISVNPSDRGNVIRIHSQTQGKTVIRGIRGDRAELEACKVFVFDEFVLVVDTGFFLGPNSTSLVDVKSGHVLWRNEMTRYPKLDGNGLKHQTDMVLGKKTLTIFGVAPPCVYAYQLRKKDGHLTWQFSWCRSGQKEAKKSSLSDLFD